MSRSPEQIIVEVDKFLRTNPSPDVARSLKLTMKWLEKYAAAEELPTTLELFTGLANVIFDLLMVFEKYSWYEEYLNTIAPAAKKLEEESTELTRAEYIRIESSARWIAAERLANFLKGRFL